MRRGMMAKHSKIYRIDLSISRGVAKVQYVAVGRQTRRDAVLRHYCGISDASITRAYNAMRALAGRHQIHREEQQ